MEYNEHKKKQSRREKVNKIEIEEFFLSVLPHSNTPLLYLNLHRLGLDDVDFVLVPAPHPIIHHSHAAYRVVRVAQVHEVIVAEIPLTI